MATCVLVIGESGTGKSSSMRTLDPKETFIINVQNKSLPFKGWKKLYTPLTKENPSGNLFITDKCEAITKTLDYISEKRPEIKNVIVDDTQYIMANMFMARAKEKGYEKFTDIGKALFDTIYCGAQLSRPDLIIYFLSHSDTNEHGQVKCKTIGRLLDDKISVEGMFTIVLQSIVFDGQYLFVTQNNGKNTCKSPMGMFPKTEIPNDLNYVSQQIRSYDNE